MSYSKEQESNMAHDRAVCMASFRQFVRTRPDMTFGQIVLSIINSSFIKEGRSLESLLTVSDRDMYKMISRAEEREQKETEYFNGEE